MRELQNGATGFSFNLSNSMVRRLYITIRGAVQGVGFRPFVYRLAAEMKLTGWVLNSAQGVFIEVEGEKSILDTFLLRLEKEKPPRSFIQSLEFSFLDPIGFSRFEIRHSESNGERTAFVLPDTATCPDCLREIFDPSNRRYLYPFTNCTNCGPRFTIIEALPYDRPNTSMKIFEMCKECQYEYENPLDRRFHAQPNACPKCGPHLELWDESGTTLETHHEALLSAVEAIRSGKIVAFKGLGGFHLIVDARNEEAVIRLRERKHREEKPFAMMFPTIELVKEYCIVNDFEERLLLSPESPIVLLARKAQIPNPKSQISSFVAPNNPYLGIMLPYTPLHHILMRELGFPVVATSGNLSDEPICTDEHESLTRLKGIADVFLVHNRPIVRHVDDSIVRVMMDRELVFRRARGYAPLPITLCHSEESRHVLAVGAHLKNTVAMTSGNNIFISQHIGDLETKESFEAFKNVIVSFKKLYQVEPQTIAADLHPDYFSTHYATETGLPLHQVQHHYAHVASCMAENQLEGKVLGVSWDGTGYGLDGTIWGGEFLLTDETSFEHVAAFKQFRLPGGERAIKEPRRTALGVLYELFGKSLFDSNDLVSLKAFSLHELLVLRQMLGKNINAPVTSSVGRLFDAVASIIGVRQKMSFEGQAAMELEFLTADVNTEERYEFQISPACSSGRNCESRIGQSAISSKSPPKADSDNPQSPIVIDWSPTIHSILEDTRTQTSPAVISAKFHNTLTEIIIKTARMVDEERVVLTGGCFQNKYLTERTVRRLEQEGFRPYWHQRVPPNDGGISLGQIYAVLRKQSGKQLNNLSTEQIEEVYESSQR